jgi:hypothetical protein
VPDEGGDGQRHPTVAHQADDPVAEPHHGVVPAPHRAPAHQAAQPGGQALSEQARLAGVVLALEDESEHHDRAHQAGQADHGGEHAPAAGLALHGEDGERHDRQPQLGEVVPDAGHDHGQGRARLREAPRREDRVGQAHAQRTARRQGVRDGGGRLGEHHRLRVAQPGRGDDGQDPVRRQVPRRRHDEHHHLPPGERAHGVPHLGDVGELAEHVPEDADNDGEREHDLEHLAHPRVEAPAPGGRGCGRSDTRVCRGSGSVGCVHGPILLGKARSPRPQSPTPVRAWQRPGFPACTACGRLNGRRCSAPTNRTGGLTP